MEDKAIDKIIIEMQTRISNAWQAWDGAEPYDADEMFEKYGDETDAAERGAHAKLKALLVEARADELRRTICHKHGWNDSCFAIKERLDKLTGVNELVATDSQSQNEPLKSAQLHPSKTNDGGS